MKRKAYSSSSDGIYSRTDQISYHRVADLVIESELDQLKETLDNKSI